METLIEVVTEYLLYIIKIYIRSKYIELVKVFVTILLIGTWFIKFPKKMLSNFAVVSLSPQNCLNFEYIMIFYESLSTQIIRNI